MSGLEPVAIVIGAVVSSALGAAWYSPALFGPAWIRELGLNEEDLAPDAVAMVGSIVSCFVAATAIDFLVGSTGASGWIEGLGVGALVGLGIVAMTMLSDALFSGWSRKLYAIQLGYRALYLVLMGALSGAWR
ncbi:MAG: DUF1761 domain-containing protein [Myxococcota bacterium]